MFADLVSVVNPEAGTVSRKTRIRPVSTLSREPQEGSQPEYVSHFEVECYLHSGVRVYACVYENRFANLASSNFH
jgi:hypothetical protein